jgi:hypothetical protein
MEILTVEEVAQVDGALLTSQDKFLARITLYALRALKDIAQTTGLAIDIISPEQVLSWVEQDETVKSQVEQDPSFKTFFSNLVVASLKPLRQVAAVEHVPIDQLTIEAVVAWYEAQAREKLQRGE